MEIDLVKNIVEIAPGFIAVAVARFITGNMNKEFSASKNVLDYFLYGGAVWILNIGVGKACQLMERAYPKDSQTAAAILLAVVMGVMWPTFLKGFCLRAANWINRKLGRNQVFAESSILEKEFEDGRDHYLAVYRNNQKITEGWLRSKTVPENAFSLTVDEEWAKWFEDNKHEEIAIVYLDKDTYIKEYIQPPEDV